MADRLSVGAPIAGFSSRHQKLTRGLMPKQLLQDAGMWRAMPSTSSLANLSSAQVWPAWCRELHAALCLQQVESCSTVNCTDALPKMSLCMQRAAGAAMLHSHPTTALLMLCPAHHQRNADQDDVVLQSAGSAAQARGRSGPPQQSAESSQSTWGSPWEHLNDSTPSTGTTTLAGTCCDQSHPKLDPW